MLPDPKELFQQHYDALEAELHEAGIPTHRRDVQDMLADRAYAAMQHQFADFADDMHQRAKDAR